MQTRPVRRQRTIPALLAALLALPATAAPSGDVTADDLARAQARISQAQERVAAARGELTGQESRLRDADRAVAKVSAERRRLKTRERDLAASLARIQREHDALARRSQALADAVARDARDAWMLGRQQQWRLWLGADDPAKVARIVRYYDYLQRDRARRLAEFRAARAALDASRERLAAEQQALAQAREELAGRERELAQARDAQREAVQRLAADLRSRSDELKRLRADEAALRAVFQAAREAFADLPPQATGAPLKQRRGKLRWPVAGKVIAGFGSPLAEGQLNLNGILIAAAEGSEVRTVHAGRVVYADWLRGYGLLVIVDHGDGYLSVYGHNASLLRESGDWVKEGEALATVGSSGGRARPALYFELRAAGQPQDPMRWLRR